MAFEFSKEQKLAIYSTGQNIIVSAGAGSGKTAVLTKRIEQILLSGVNVNQLLVLTFTVPAANEMKERIVKAMKKHELLKNRLNEVDNAYITTFDSFSFSVVKKYQDRLNLSDISIVDKSVIGVYKRKVMDEIFLKYYQEENRDFIDMIYELTGKSDTSLKTILIQIADKIDLKPNYNEFLLNYNEFFYNENTFKSYLEEYEMLIKEKIKAIKGVIEELSYYLTEQQHQKYIKTYTPLFSAKNYDEIRYTMFSISNPSIPNSCDEIADIKARLTKIVKEIKEMLQFTHIEEMKQTYFSTKKYVDIIVDILKQYFNKINEFKFSRACFEFSDIAKMAISLVKENEDIRNELKYSFKEILLDEYQDTSDIQEIFISYISNNNVYMVGDVKQSIYAFRNANPVIFKEKYDKYDRIYDLSIKPSKNGGKIDLNQNFRSNRPVLKCINDIFNHVMDDTFGQANFIKDHQMNFGLVNYDLNSQEDKIKFVTYDTDVNKKYKYMDIDMFYVVKDIKEKIKNKDMVYDKEEESFRPCTYKDFAILMADGGFFDSFSMLLSYNGIPNAIYKNEDINKGVIFSVIKNIIKLIVLDYKNTFDNSFMIAFYAVGKSFVCQYDDNTLFDYITNKTYMDSLLYKTIHDFSYKIENTSLNDLIYQIYDAFKVYDKIITLGNINQNLTGLEYISKMSLSMDKLDLNIFDFVEYIDDIIENEEKLEYAGAKIEEDKVKIMTIHKSKGLEFPIVYFINNSKLFYDSNKKAKILFDNKYGIITPYYNQGEGKTIAAILAKENNNLSIISEKIRLLYVALTRAREKIVVLSPRLKNFPSIDKDDGVVSNLYRRKYNSFSSIYNSVLNIFSDVTISIDPDTLNINNDYLKGKKLSYDHFISPLDIQINKLNNNLSFDILEKTHASKAMNHLPSKEELKAIKLGSKIHSIFEQCNFANPNFDNLSNQHKQYILSFLNSDIMKNIKNAKVYKEFEFIMQEDEKIIHGIIDLMVEYDDYIDIIDYKLSNTSDASYIKQLNTYKHYISKKKNKKVNIYLYSIIKNTFTKIEE